MHIVHPREHLKLSSLSPAELQTEALSEALFLESALRGAEAAWAPREAPAITLSLS